MIDHAVLLDARADTFPVGLAGTPFEAVYLALRMVAADVWDVDPRAYRAAIAWGWYLTHRPADLAGFRDLLCNALVSEAAPLVKPTQTVEELIGYLSAWREYKSTYGQLEALYSFFAASADIQPVEGERFFYICISGIDWSRPLTYDEAFAIAQRATPLGAFFNIYFRYEDELSIPVRCADYIGFSYRIGDDYELSRQTGSALPTVSKSGDWSNNNRLYPYGGGSSLNSFFAIGGVIKATTNGSKTVPYNGGNSYCVFDWFLKDAIGPSDVVLVNNNGNLAFSNVSGHTFYIRWFNVAVCSSNQATVVPVYNSSNVAYNAFKYTSLGTDYYYVLDGTQTDWTDDLSSIGYYLHPSEIDIDVKWGDAVTIPEGYTIQSVKSTVAYMFKDFSHASMTEVMVYSAPGTKDLYCTDTDISLMGWRVAPCLQIFQITTINSQNSYGGFYLTNRTSQTSTTEFTLNTAFSLLNGDYAGSGFFLRYQASGPNAARNSVANSTYPLQFRRYDENDALIEYYFNVPTTLWRLQNGVFQWLGDSRQNQDLAYYYYGSSIRIHCIRA